MNVFVKHLLLALWLTPVWCFEQRCEIGEPALIERSYLRPSFVLCLLPAKPVVARSMSAGQRHGE